ncbi:MAG: DNA methyltransferase, partial [Desulfobacteraceae bacterium]|nr:DNA methyltransferase [Desulfobacteraceae bacterium]
MEINNSSLDQLKAFLNKLFQFESQDLDFGVYKILHYKHNELKQFINELLVGTVNQQLQTLTNAQKTEAQEKLDDIEQDDIVKGWLAADDDEKKTLEKFGKEKIKQYQELKHQVDSVQVSVDTENQIYNHLTIFFSRYYDKGDFISKRRFGKNEKYMVPYNGEETHFYWANQDQYYIKSSQTFTKFSFRAGPYKSDLIVNFKLTKAQTEQGNVKADANKFFILSEKDPELNPDEINIFFEYRPISGDEKKSIGTRNIQEKLNEQTAKKLESQLKKHAPAAGLWDMETDQTLLLRKLHQYTKKNQYDFFIHKNLKGFLERELDFYIKSELVSVDDLYVSDTDTHLERIRHNFKTIKVFKEIADTIITFLVQIEDFQKKLWEKKKFVLSTEWVITIDRLVEYVGIDVAAPILEEVIQNKDQIAEWKKWFGKKIIPSSRLTLNSLKSDLFFWIKLPIDTIHFPQSFKEKLLNILSSRIDLEKMLDGLVLDTDNYQGLQLLRDKFYDQINVIYIDPPYNSGGDDFLYKDNFRNSSWLSMLADRIPIAKDLLAEDGLFFSSIDDKDSKNKVTHRLSNLLEAH